MDLPIVLSHKTAWLYHNVARPSEPLSRASILYDEDSLANEAEPTADLPKLGLDAKGLRASTAVRIVTDYLVSLGIPREELDYIDTLVILSRWQRAFWWLMRPCALSKRVRG